MKKMIIILLFIFSPLFFFAQENETVSEEIVSFAEIDEVPIFPGCEKLEKPLQKVCLQKEIQKHIARKFQSDLVYNLGLDPGKKRIYVMFKIDKEGYVVDVKSKGPHKALEREAIDVVKLLPQMIPGKHKGKNVNVKYTLPITLIVDEPEKKEDNKDSNGN